VQLVGRKRGRWFVFVPVLVIVSLVLAGAAGAVDGRIQLSASGQSAARAAVIKRADLGAAGGWVGGVTQPDLSQTLKCPSYRPKQSDLIVIGAAASTWKNSGLQLYSVAQVLRTPEMVRLDWQRTVLDPRVLPCVRGALAKEFGTAAQLVSFRRIVFPRIADSTRAYRAVADAKTSAGSVRIMYDIVLVASGRTEITLTAAAPMSTAESIAAAEVRLARVLAARASAGTAGA
jgi:hypothetical protein